jgi:hypothetical protein
LQSDAAQLNEVFSITAPQARSIFLSGTLDNQQGDAVVINILGTSELTADIRAMTFNTVGINQPEDGADNRTLIFNFSDSKDTLVLSSATDLTGIDRIVVINGKVEFTNAKIPDIKSIETDPDMDQLSQLLALAIGGQIETQPPVMSYQEPMPEINYISEPSSSVLPI